MVFKRYFLSRVVYENAHPIVLAVSLKIIRVYNENNFKPIFNCLS